MIRRKLGAVITQEIDWGYQWENYNIQWDGGTQPPLSALTNATMTAYPPNGVQAAAFGGSLSAVSPPTGEYFSVYGITLSGN